MMPAVPRLALGQQGQQRDYQGVDQRREGGARIDLMLSAGPVTGQFLGGNRQRDE
jgi:hypothetical protein